MKDTDGLTMAPVHEPIGVQDGPGWGVVMALHVLGRVPWDLFLELCRVAGYGNVPMGFFEESWEGRPRSDGHEAYTLMRGGKTEDYVELNDFAHTWIPEQSLPDRMLGALRLPPLLEAAASWLAKQEGN